MKIARVSPLTGQTNVRDIAGVTEEMLAELAMPGRRAIQQIMPEVSSEDREFVLTGYTPEDWTAIFPE